MKHIIEYSQIEFFKTNRYLQLEGMVKESRLDSICQKINHKKSQIAKIDHDHQSQILKMHDLFRDIDELKKFLTQQTMAHVLADLTQESAFRLLFDQLLAYPLPASLPNPLCVADLSFQGAIIAGILHIEGKESEDTIFPSKRGNITFFDPTINLDLNSLIEPSSSEFILFAFGLNESRYRFKEKDPHTHLLKNRGYVFGDQLGNQTHPLFFVKN
jgi:hypothetical protein